VQGMETEQSNLTCMPVEVAARHGGTARNSRRKVL